ncbi:MAG: hypothetical protein GY760_11695 [Deltaproteobacteria bacterium]|nr:hypothetical protein [Deltaproteobacteria bacterium]
MNSSYSKIENVVEDYFSDEKIDKTANKNLSYDIKKRHVSLKHAKNSLIHLIEAGFSTKDRSMTFLRVKDLIKEGADVNQRSKDGNTPLIAAIQMNCFETSDLLLKNGADIGCTNVSGENAIDIAKRNKNKKILTLLLNKRSKTKVTLKESLESTDVNFFKALLKDATTRQRGAALLETAILHDTEKAFLILEYKISQLTLNKAFFIFLTQIKDEQILIRVLKRLIDKGAEVKSRDENGNTLLLASQLKYKLICFLIDAGVNPNFRNQKGETLILRAVRLNAFDIIKLLVEKGVDLNHLNNDKESALYLAIRNSNLDIIRYLIKNSADLNQETRGDLTPLYLLNRYNMLKFVMDAKLPPRKGENKKSLNYNFEIIDPKENIDHFFPCTNNIIDHWDETDVTGELNISIEGEIKPLTIHYKQYKYGNHYYSTWDKKHYIATLRYDGIKIVTKEYFTYSKYYEKTSDKINTITMDALSDSGICFSEIVERVLNGEDLVLVKEKSHLTIGDSIYNETPFHSLSFTEHKKVQKGNHYVKVKEDFRIFLDLNTHNACIQRDTSAYL